MAHELSSATNNGPLTVNSKLFGVVTGVGDPSPDLISITLVYDYIKSQTDTLYPTLLQFNNLDADTLQTSGGTWNGESLRASGFASGTDSDDLATYGQLQDAILTGTFDLAGLGTIASVDAAADLLLIYDTSLTAYKKVTPATLIGIGTSVQAWDAQLDT